MSKIEITEEEIIDAVAEKIANRLLAEKSFRHQVLQHVNKVIEDRGLHTVKEMMTDLLSRGKSGAGAARSLYDMLNQVQNMIKRGKDDP